MLQTKLVTLNEIEYHYISTFSVFIQLCHLLTGTVQQLASITHVKHCIIPQVSTYRRDKKKEPGDEAATAPQIFRYVNVVATISSEFSQF